MVSFVLWRMTVWRCGKPTFISLCGDWWVIRMGSDTESVADSAKRCVVVSQYNFECEKSHRDIAIKKYMSWNIGIVYLQFTQRETWTCLVEDYTNIQAGIEERLSFLFSLVYIAPCCHLVVTVAQTWKYFAVNKPKFFDQSSSLIDYVPQIQSTKKIEKNQTNNHSRSYSTSNWNLIGGLNQQTICHLTCFHLATRLQLTETGSFSMVHQMISNRTASVWAAAQRSGITDLRDTSKKKKKSLFPQFHSSGFNLLSPVWNFPSKQRCTWFKRIKK